MDTYLDKMSQYKLPVHAYATFDAVDMKQHMSDILRQSGLFPDIDFEGSNINTITDVLAFSYHLLLYYLNNTSSEALFNQSSLLENMNKIVSLIGYNPTGRQSALLNFTCTGDISLPVDFYTINRYSNINVNGIPYSFTSDVNFQKFTSGTEDLPTISDNYVFSQGIYREYPIYTAIGEEFEQLTISVDSADTFVNYNGMGVYVQDIDTGEWSEWTQIESLFFADSTSRVYEKRLNGNGRYEIKFGNGINGAKLNEGDALAVYYLESMGQRGTISANTISNCNIIIYNSNRFNRIKQDIYDENVNFITAESALGIKLNNPYPSTIPVDGESVDQIRNNAPILFASRNQLVTLSQYSAYTNKQFSNIASVSIADNTAFTNEYIKYFYDIGLQKPNDDLRVLMNQVAFASSCNFNDVNLFVIPAFGAIQDETTPNYLSQSLKQFMINQLNLVKAINHEIVIHDPIYVAFDLGVSLPGETITKDIRDDTRLIVRRDSNSVLSKIQIQNAVYNEILKFFNVTNNKLGANIDFAVLSQNILNIDGVKSIETTRGSEVIPKLSFVLWNPFYEKSDVQVSSQNLSLPFFKYPFLYEGTKLQSKIIVQ